MKLVLSFALIVLIFSPCSLFGDNTLSFHDAEKILAQEEISEAEMEKLHKNFLAYQDSFLEMLTVQHHGPKTDKEKLATFLSLSSVFFRLSAQIVRENGPCESHNHPIRHFYSHQNCSSFLYQAASFFEVLEPSYWRLDPEYSAQGSCNKKTWNILFKFQPKHLSSREIGRYHWSLVMLTYYSWTLSEEGFSFRKQAYERALATLVEGKNLDLIQNLVQFYESQNPFMKTMKEILF